MYVYTSPRLLCHTPFPITCLFPNFPMASWAPFAGAHASLSVPVSVALSQICNFSVTVPVSTKSTSLSEFPCPSSFIFLCQCSHLPVLVNMPPHIVVLVSLSLYNPFLFNICMLQSLRHVVLISISHCPCPSVQFAPVRVKVFLTSCLYFPVLMFVSSCPNVLSSLSH